MNLFNKLNQFAFHSQNHNAQHPVSAMLFICTDWNRLKEKWFFRWLPCEYYVSIVHWFIVIALHSSRDLERNWNGTFFRFVTLCFSYDGLQRVWNELAKRFRHFNNAHIFCVCLVSSRPQVSITNYSHCIITFNLQFYGTFRMVRRFRAVTLIEIFY